MRIRGLARPCDANPGDRGLPGFYPAVHLSTLSAPAAALGPGTPENQRGRNPSHQLCHPGEQSPCQPEMCCSSGIGRAGRPIAVHNAQRHGSKWRQSQRWPTRKAQVTSPVAAAAQAPGCEPPGAPRVSSNDANARMWSDISVGCPPRVSLLRPHLRRNRKIVRSLIEQLS